MNYFEKIWLAGFDGKLVAIAGFIYLFALIWLSYSKIKRRFERGSLGLAVIGFATHTASFVVRCVLTQRFPMANLFEYVLLLTLIIMLIYLAYLKRSVPGAGSAILVAVVAGLLLLSPFFYSSPWNLLLPALRSFWLYIHVSLTIAAQAFFAIGFVASLLYLLKRRSSAEELSRLDRITYRSISIGFSFFTAGALVAGSIWAKKAWGSYWSWDPKEVMSLVVWLVYAVYLHARFLKGLAGVTTALLSILGFILILFTAISTIFFGGLHSYS
ncbi:MAG: cytochrome c biogenesis protein CcsA [bacterium]